MVTLRNTFRWPGTWVALLLLSTCVAEALHFASPDPDPIAMQVTLALSFSWLAVLLMPDHAAPSPRHGVLVLWAVTAAAGYLAVSVSPLYDEPVYRSIRLSGAVLILVLLFVYLYALIRACSASRSNAMIVLTLILGAFFAAPLYLGVVAEARPDNTPIVDSIIAASPVSYVAAIVDYDYLHNSWFYRNTPYGGIRFNYPSSGLMTFCYLIITLVLMGANLLNNRFKTRTRSQ